MKQWNPAHKCPIEINGLEFKSHLRGLSGFNLLLNCWFLTADVVWEPLTEKITYFIVIQCYRGSHSTSELKGNQLQRAECFVLGTISPHAFSHPEEGKRLPPARDQVRRAGSTRHRWWDLVVNQLRLLTTLQLYYLFWYKVIYGPFVILSKHWKKKTQISFPQTATKDQKEQMSLLSLTPVNSDSHSYEQDHERPNQAPWCNLVLPPLQWINCYVSNWMPLPGHRTS